MRIGVTAPAAAVRYDAREEASAWGAERAVDERFAFELPDVGPMVQHAHLEIETVPRRDGPAELRRVDAEEVHERIGRVERITRVREETADLRERLEDQDAGHDGAPREMPEEPRLVHRDAFVPANALVRHDLRDPVDQHEGPAVRQDLEDPLDVDGGAGHETVDESAEIRGNPSNRRGRGDRGCARPQKPAFRAQDGRVSCHDRGSGGYIADHAALGGDAGAPSPMRT